MRVLVNALRARDRLLGLTRDTDDSQGV